MQAPGQQGFSLIEVLVTLFILLVGLLGLVGLLIQAQRAQLESYQRVQALVLMNDMVNRLSTNRKAAACYVNASAKPFFGTGYSAGSTLRTCPSNPTGTSNEQVAQAEVDLTEWNALLQANLINARGCITVTTDPVTAQLTYRVAVVWQGNGKTGAPTSTTCGQGLYGADDDERRAVVVPMQFPTLS
jgi:type IV pilus assembly protein PilV